MEAKKGSEVVYIRPDPLHLWYGSFTVCQTVRMWMSVFDECESVFDRVLALRSLEYFRQPPEKIVYDEEEYTKNDAFRDIILEKIKKGEIVPNSETPENANNADWLNKAGFTNTTVEFE